VELLPEGLTILAGRPKCGKSWLALHIAMQVAAGGRTLESTPVEPGPVLYLALEDTKRRL
jgi:RecA-family ATPase